jgi:hypothetical protein
MQSLVPHLKAAPNVTEAAMCARSGNRITLYELPHLFVTQTISENTLYSLFDINPAVSLQ